MNRDVRQHLADITRARLKLVAEIEAVERQEAEAIAAAWRDRVPPTEIARLAERSTAHVRKLRPADVPPARMGGNAAPKRRRRTKRSA